MKPEKKFSMYRVFINWLKSTWDKFYLWFFCRFFTFFIAIALGLRGIRMSHNNGIAGKGRLKIVDDLDLPNNDFFKPGHEFNIRVRHASATFLDDAMKVIRSCSIKFSDHHFNSPFDIQLNSGNFGVFWSAISFWKFASSRAEKWGVDWVKYNHDYPQGSKGAQLGVRRHATSFHNVRYYSQSPYLFITTEGIKYYCKYKVRPFEDVAETGIDPNPSVIDACNQRILPHETRGRNFLKDEYEDRINREGAKYRLQIQIRMASDDEDPEIFNNMTPWDEERFPWKELAEFEVSEVLDWDESCRTTFSLKHMPKSLGIIPAKSVYDYNSMNYMRANTEFARKVRLFAYRVFGPPKPIPDDDNRNVT